MREFIKEVLVNVHANCTTDKYGQMGKYNLSLNSLFGKRVEEVEAYNNVHRIYSASTYGGQVGIYRAITEILDTEIKQACNEAFARNENMLRNLNSW